MTDLQKASGPAFSTDKCYAYLALNNAGWASHGAARPQTPPIDRLISLKYYDVIILPIKSVSS